MTAIKNRQAILEHESHWAYVLLVGHYHWGMCKSKGNWRELDSIEIMEKEHSILHKNMHVCQRQIHQLHNLPMGLIRDRDILIHS